MWHYYDVASAFDARNRRVFKSFYDETTTKTAQWFFYYDAPDRLTEIRYTPDTSSPGTYSVFQLIWLGQKLIAFWETDLPSAVTSKRYVASDEMDRPTQLWNWPSSGDATRTWAVSQSAWGLDTNILGPGVFQPILFAGQYQDVEAAAYENDGATIHRPGVALNGFRSYDPLVGQYLQFDPLTMASWSTYIYVSGNPVRAFDLSGMLANNSGCTDLGEHTHASTDLNGNVVDATDTIEMNCPPPPPPQDPQPEPTGGGHSPYPTGPDNPGGFFGSAFSILDTFFGTKSRITQCGQWCGDCLAQAQHTRCDILVDGLYVDGPCSVQCKRSIDESTMVNQCADACLNNPNLGKYSNPRSPQSCPYLAPYNCSYQARQVGQESETLDTTDIYLSD